MQHKLNTTMKKIFNLVLTALIFLTNNLLNAQAPPPPIGGGGGGTTPESAAAPIDMYIYLFAVVAIAFIIYFGKKYQKKLI